MTKSAENEIKKLEITAYGSEGQGIGRLDGMAVFVPGALVGETVTVSIEKTTASYAVARLLYVISSSTQRKEPPCPYFAECGGCSLMHMKYEHQLEFKRQRVKDAFERIGGFRDIEVLPCIGSNDTLRYRNKAVFSFAGSEGRVRFGCIAEGSHRVIPVSDCLIQSEVSVKAAEAVCDWANRCKIPVYNEKTGRGELRHLMLRTASAGETMAVVITSDRLRFENELVSALRAAVPGIASVIHNINPARTNLIMGRKNRVIFGAETITEYIDELSFSAGAESFLQVNPAQTLRMYAEAINGLMLSKEDEAVDLYCGIGTISLLMARQAGSVIGVEYVASAIEDAKRNAAQNAIENAEFICGTAETVFPKIVKSGKKITKLLLDPPRKGAMREALDAITQCGAQRIAYISCNPATFARDCRILADAGYRIEKVQPFDMFAHSFHVECVTIMTKSN